MSVPIDRQLDKLSGATGSDTTVAVAWYARAAELARWAFERYVIRDDIWGGYIALADRGKVRQRPDGSTYSLGTTCTRPAKARRGKESLTLAVLERHFQARGAQDIVGIHTTNLKNLSKFGTVEVDHHGPDSNSQEQNLRAALGWHDELRRLGFRPLLWDSNGAGGFHLDILLAEPVHTPRLFAFLGRLVADYRTRGLPARAETFPKQARLDPRPDGRGCCGNWVRLPGRHHTREHWTKVWDGSRWLSAAEAVSFILGLPGDPVGLIPAMLPAPVPAKRPVRPAAPRPSAGRCPSGSAVDRSIGSYLGRLPHLAEGQGRDDVAYHFACWLVRDLDLDDDAALAWLERWDVGNRPPKGRERLTEILANAHEYGRHAYGSGLAARTPAARSASRVVITFTWGVAHER
jgi:hypothetical protein